MDSTYTIGGLLVAISAILLAAHLQEWLGGVAERQTPLAKDYFLRRRRRRTVASSLIGVIGFLLVAFETVPRTPLSFTAYLLCLVLMTGWILWLAFVDIFAGRKYYDQAQIDQLAAQLKQADLEEFEAESPEN